MERRKFIQLAGRSGLLLGLAGIAAHSIYKTFVLDVDVCLVSSDCNSCIRFEDCTEPQASNIKKNEEESSK